MDRAVIVAVSVVGMMEMAVHQIIDMVAMGNGFVSASRAVLVVGFVGLARVVGRASGWIGGIDLKAVLVHMVRMRVVQVPVVKVVHMVVVTDRRVATSLTVRGFMVVMFATGHEAPPRVVEIFSSG